MVRPRRSIRGGGQAPVHLDDVEIEQGNEETLPPPPPIGGETNGGGAGPQGGVGPRGGVEPQVAQGPAVSDMMPLIQALVRACQTAMAGVITTRRLMDDGCRAYLAYVMNPNMGEVRPRDIMIVCDFPRAFPEELPSLPPDREVEFVIETHADSAPVSISPYRMAPKELKELKTQLQELLD
ncbi:hypothetical protein V6N11_008535 [Hibiscus sabdariffa]|uniref:Uncharacterized protein n=1 Tax=Hibiscus sabdariffa TaxID=183260 RepID=A0ABR2PP19_9ROSI